MLKKSFNHAKGIICLDKEEVYEELKRMFPGKIILTSTNAINVDDYYTSDDKICDGLFAGDYSERKGIKYLY